MPMNEDIDLCEMHAVFACRGLLEGTFVLTIISLCSNANNVGDLKILTPNFLFFFIVVFLKGRSLCVVPVFHMYIDLIFI